MIYKIGSQGESVAIIQNNLRVLAYDPGATDYIFGDNTENAVRRFQSIYGLTPDGIVGDNTWTKLISFSYNCGVTALQDSTLLKDIKANAPTEKIKADFMMWVKCNGNTALGLQRRRNDEFKIYANADYTRTYPTF